MKAWCPKLELQTWNSQGISKESIARDEKHHTNENCKISQLFTRLRQYLYFHLASADQQWHLKLQKENENYIVGKICLVNVVLMHGIW